MTIVLFRENKECALLHSSSPMHLMLSQAGMVNPGTGIAASLVSNCDLHSCTALSNTGDARSVHLAGFEMASRRQTISHHMIFFTFTGAWSYSLLRVREEES